jgi:hypothetical protein
VTAGQPYLVNENTPNSEIFVPGVSGSIVPSGGTGGSRTTTINNYITNPVPEAASTSIKRELQKLSAMGFLEPSAL